MITGKPLLPAAVQVPSQRQQNHQLGNFFTRAALCVAIPAVIIISACQTKKPVVKDEFTQGQIILVDTASGQKAYLKNFLGSEFSSKMGAEIGKSENNGTPLGSVIIEEGAEGTVNLGGRRLTMKNEGITWKFYTGDTYDGGESGNPEKTAKLAVFE